MGALTCHHSSVKYNLQTQPFMSIYTSFKTTDVLGINLSQKNYFKLEL